MFASTSCVTVKLKEPQGLKEVKGIGVARPPGLFIGVVQFSYGSTNRPGLSVEVSYLSCCFI